MILDHVVGIFTHPSSEWLAISLDKRSRFYEYINNVPFLALVPAVCYFIGTTQIGWRSGSEETLTYLSANSALRLSILSYTSAMLGIWIFGEFIHWLHRKYCQGSFNPHHSMALAIYVVTPVYLAGFAGLYPDILFNALILIVAIIYSVFLLLQGMPILMGTPKDRALKYSIAVFAVGIGLFVLMRLGTLALWAYGFGIEYVTGPSYLQWQL